MRREILWAAVLGLSFCRHARAQAPQTTQTKELDGASLAQKGNDKGAAACLSCHGARGEGQAEAGFPRLAGLTSEYLVKQLDDYSSGARDNAVMGPIAKALSPAEKDKVSGYYASLEIPPVAVKSKSSASLIKQGEKLANVGDMKLQLQACNNCHGPGGIGVAPLIPGLAGQNAAYIESQLKAWKSGQRKNSLQQMTSISERLDEPSIKALAAYFSQVKLSGKSTKSGWQN